jgi:hypothetical protein
MLSIIAAIAALATAEIDGMVDFPISANSITYLDGT